MDTETNSPVWSLDDYPINKLPDVTQEHVDQLPTEQPNDWPIEMRYLPIAHRGHAYLALIDPSGKVQRELHGLARSRSADNLVALGMDGAHLVGVQSPRPLFDPTEGPPRTISLGTVYSGSYDDTVRGKWRTGLQAAVDMNAKNLDYKAHDVSYELGTNGGQIQNSNSANFTFGKPMHLDLSTAIRNKGLERVFPGWGRDVLDQSYQPYVAPPQVRPDTP